MILKLTAMIYLFYIAMDQTYIFVDSSNKQSEFWWHLRKDILVSSKNAAYGKCVNLVKSTYILNRIHPKHLDIWSEPEESVNKESSLHRMQKLLDNILQALQRHKTLYKGRWSMSEWVNKVTNFCKT